VITAGNSKEAYKRIVGDRPDLIVLDVMMDYDEEGMISRAPSRPTRPPERSRYSCSPLQRAGGRAGQGDRLAHGQDWPAEIFMQKPVKLAIWPPGSTSCWPRREATEPSTPEESDRVDRRPATTAAAAGAAQRAGRAPVAGRAPTTTCVQELLAGRSDLSREQLIPLLQQIQAREGSVASSHDRVGHGARHTVASVYGVATFYNQFRFAPLAGMCSNSAAGRPATSNRVSLCSSTCSDACACARTQLRRQTLHRHQGRCLGLLHRSGHQARW